MIPKKKIKLLFYGDSPTCDTGFGTVSKSILPRLHATGLYDITIIGINFWGDPHDFPFKIWPACYGQGNKDIYGLEHVIELLEKHDFDVLFTLQDTFIFNARGFGNAIRNIRDGAEKFEEGTHPKTGERIQNIVRRGGKGFKWLMYYPIDAKPEKKWLDESVKLCDIAVPYTHYAAEESRKIVERDYNVIYHGFDPKIFYPMQPEEKDAFQKKYFPKIDFTRDFMVCNINRNQSRKGLLQTFLAFKIFQQLYPNALLYTHCNVHDVGGNLQIMARQLGIDNRWIYPDPRMWEMGKRIPADYINGILNISEINMSTTLGEGFGLSMIEAMGAGTINVFPGNTAITEILAEGRGITVKCGNTPNNLIMVGHEDNSLIRPVVDVDNMVEKLIYAHRSPEQRNAIEERAYDWALANCNWDKIAEKFHTLIQSNLSK